MIKKNMITAKHKEMKKYYRTNEACEMAGISRATFFRWLKQGVIKDVMYKDRRGWRLFADEDIEQLREEATKMKAEPFQPELKFANEKNKRGKNQ